MIETIVYYSIQRAGSFGVVPSPINSRAEKEMAQAEARQTVVVTMGDLQIVVFVCGDDITDTEIYEQINFLKQAGIGLVSGVAKSDYSENPEGEGFINDQPEEYGQDEDDEL